MRKKKTLSKVFIIFLSLVLICTTSLTAFADGSVTISTSGSTGSMSLLLSGEPTVFSVTVPSSLTLCYKPDGTVVCSDEAKIINNSYGPVTVTGITVEGRNGWEIIGYDEDMSDMHVGDKKLSLCINGEETLSDSTISFSEENWPHLHAVCDDDRDELDISYSAKMPCQTVVYSNEEIARVTFTISWY